MMFVRSRLSISDRQPWRRMCIVHGSSWEAEVAGPWQSIACSLIWVCRRQRRVLSGRARARAGAGARYRRQGRHQPHQRLRRVRPPAGTAAGQPGAGAVEPHVMLIVAEAPERILEIVEERRSETRACVLPELRSLHNRLELQAEGALPSGHRRHQGGAERDHRVPQQEAARHPVDARLVRGARPRLDGRSGQRRDRGWRVPARDPLARQGPARAVAAKARPICATLRYAPPGFAFTMTTYIYDDKVALISSRRENFAMTIESEEFASMQTHFFEVLWAAASPTGRARAKAGAARWWPCAPTLTPRSSR